MTSVVYGQSSGCLGTSAGIRTSVFPNIYGRYLRLSEMIMQKGQSALAVAPRYNTMESNLVWDGVIQRWIS